MNDTNSSTNVSLLLRLKADEQDQFAWRDFVHRYGGRIHQWCLHRKLQPADAEDVTQSVLLKLAKAIRTFQYNPSLTFRGWLRTITENAIRDFFRDDKKWEAGKGGSSMCLAIDNAEAPKELADILEKTFDLELFEQAMQNVKSRISEHRWLAWELAAREQMKANDIADRLNMNIANVYTARNQVQTMIRKEVATIEERPIQSELNPT